MTASAMSLSSMAVLPHKREGASGCKSKVSTSREGSAFFENSQSDYCVRNEITEVCHRVNIGGSNPGKGAAHFSTERDDIHDGHLSLVGSTYRRRDVNTSTTRGKKLPLTPQCVERALGPIIRNRPVKAVASAAGRSADAVKKWRQTALPEAWAAFINLLTADDEVYLAVMELAGRKPAAALTDDQKRALAEAMKMLGLES